MWKGKYTSVEPRPSPDAEPEARASRLSVPFELNSLPSPVRSSVVHTRWAVGDRWRSLQSIGKTIARGIRRVQWRRNWKTILLHLVLVGILIGLIYLMYFVGKVSETFAANYSVGCLPNGDFDADTGYYELKSYNGFSTSGLFEITLGFGHFSFTTAKVLDLVFDIFCGRGIQFAMGFIAFNVFSKSLLRSMEQAPVSYRTFEALAFSGTSISTFLKLLSDFLTNRGLRARLAMAWIIIATVYVVAFSTLMSAMTGYSANSQPYVEDTDNNLIPWDSSSHQLRRSRWQADWPI